MRKKKGIIITLAMAGLISVGGAVGLHASMERNMNEKQVAQVERKQEMSQEINQEDVNLEETDEKVNNLNNIDQSNAAQDENIKADTVNQTWNNEENIYVPEGAEIISDNEFGCEIVWDNCNISYMHYSYETEEDLGLGKLKPIIDSAVKKYAGEDLGPCDMQIFMEVPYDEGMETQEVQGDIDAIIADCEDGETCEIKGEDGEIYEIKCEDGETCVTMYVVDESESMPEELRDIYYLDSKCYQVHILTESDRYDIWIDSVTGLVTVFNHEDEDLGTFTNGWDVNSGTDVVYEVSSEEQKEYDAIIESFIADELKLGTVEKFYAQDMGVSYFGTSGNNVRAYYNVICKTVDGAVVEVTFDIGEKKVTSFRTSVNYLSN
ncbi:MAG: hypothetical protein E7257_10065 [Lachnospiraceae bacterium]|nr:hypothetical protein [Lachnospiraceae bacterium]